MVAIDAMSHFKIEHPALTLDFVFVNRLIAMFAIFERKNHGVQILVSFVFGAHKPPYDARILKR